MTSPNTFPNRFTEIDELTRREHSFLTAEDECYFLGQYTPREGFLYSTTNDTIQNLKKPMDRSGTQEWKYKGQAIRICANAFATALKAFEIDTMTFVPVPPSKIESDPLYDNRLVRMLQIAHQTCGGLDIRKCVEQTENLRPSHISGDRPTPSEIVGVYRFRKRLSRPRPTKIAIVDDVLTTGAHFKAMETILLDQYPGVNVVGLFLARREVPQLDLSKLFC